MISLLFTEMTAFLISSAGSGYFLDEKADGGRVANLAVDHGFGFVFYLSPVGKRHDAPAQNPSTTQTFFSLCRWQARNPLSLAVFIKNSQWLYLMLVSMPYMGGLRR